MNCAKANGCAVAAIRIEEALVVRPEALAALAIEREEVTAVETGPNTGVFLVPALPVRAPPVVAGDRILEGNPNDVFEMEVLGCGRRIDTVVTLMQPASVVFDSNTNAPVADERLKDGVCAPAAPSSTLCPLRSRSRATSRKPSTAPVS